jgi:hypothetical protein
MQEGSILNLAHNRGRIAATAAVCSVSVLLFFVSGEASYSALAIRSIHIWIPLIVALVVWIWRDAGNRLSRQIDATMTNYRVICLLGSAFLFFEILSFKEAVDSGYRTRTYFAFVAAATMTLVAQLAVFLDIKRTLLWVILLETGLLVSLEVYVKTVTFADYVGNGDVLIHEYYTQLISQTGSIPPSMGLYSHYPVFQVLSASVFLVCGGDSPILSIRQWWCIAGFFIPFALYRLSGVVHQDVHFRLLVSVVASNGFGFLSNLSQSVAGVLVMVIFVYLLCSVLELNHSVSTLCSALLFSTVLLFTHQPNVLLCLLVLLLAVIVHSYLVSSMKTKPSWLSPVHSAEGGNPNRIFAESGRDSAQIRHLLKTRVRFVLLISFAFAAYTAIASLDIAWAFLDRPLGVVGLSAETSSVVPSLNELITRGMMNAALSVMIFLATSMILVCLFGRIHPEERKPHLLIGVVGLVSIVFYVPVVYLLVPMLNHYLKIGRFVPYLELMILVLSVGYLCVIFHRNSLRFRAMAMSVLFILVLGGTVNFANTDDTRAFGTIGIEPLPILTERDREILQVSSNHLADNTIQCDYYSYSYLSARDVKVVLGSVTDDNRLRLDGERLVVFRLDEFETHGLSFYDPSLVPLVDVGSWAVLGNANDYRSEVNVLFDYGGVIMSQWDEVVIVG